MKELLKILCVTKNDRIKKELEKNLSGENKNIGIEPWEISLSFSLKGHTFLANKFDVIILTVCKGNKENISQQINEILLTHHRNPKAQIIVICEINPYCYPVFTQTIKDTGSFAFGTAWELAKRISEMIYLEKESLKLKPGDDYEENNFKNKSVDNLLGN